MNAAAEVRSEQASQGIRELALAARAAGTTVAALSTSAKRDVLHAMAATLAARLRVAMRSSIGRGLRQGSSEGRNPESRVRWRSKRRST